VRIIVESCSVPKYLQLAEGIIQAISESKLVRGDKIGSINEISSQYKLARGTVKKAYEELQNRGIITSKQGKGFYIVSTAIETKLKIFLLFDTLNAYKETLYQSFRQTIGAHANLTIFFHHHNLRLFERMITDNLGNYGYYVIMPHFNEDISSIIKNIPPEKLLILDKELVRPDDSYASIFQPFEKDIYQALHSGLEVLQKYKRINLVLSTNSFQFIPDGIIQGFKRFCQEKAIAYQVLDNLSETDIEKGEVFIVFADSDLIRMIKYAGEHHLQLGADIGIISYDDTPMKSVLEKGITVISTDFVAMGKKAAEMILSRKIEKIKNDSGLILRRSL